MLVILLAFLLLFVLFIVWVWMAIASAVVAVAKNRNPILWSIFGLFFGPLAFFTLTRLPQGGSYWGRVLPLAEDPSAQVRTCPECEAANPLENRYCNSCGASLARRRVQPPKLGQGSSDPDESGQEGS